MNNPPPSPSVRASQLPGFLVILVCLLAVLGALFFRSFLPGMVLFSNDGPLGAISAGEAAMPSALFGLWQDLSWIGSESVSASPCFSSAMSCLLQPVGYAKFFAPISLLVVGLSAWFFFRQLNLAPTACVVGGLAAALNSDFFSTACWGVVSQPVCFAANYLALAALARDSDRFPWVRVALAGFAVGLGVTEGADIGALFSLFVAAFVLFQSWNTAETDPPAKKAGLGVARIAVIAVLAAIFAARSLDVLVGTQIKGIVGMQQDETTKQQRWAEATQFSLPKAETFQILIPGVFGYRMDFPAYAHDTPGPDQYWGTIGASEPGPQQYWRFSGTGLYAGVPVVVIAFWAGLQSLRRKGSPFPLRDRRRIWFWLAVLVITLLFAFGKYAPFYQLFYALPYASTIRNPFKFMHVFSWALIIPFAYGVHGLVALYMREPVTRLKGLTAQFKSWWAGAPDFDRRWLSGCVWAVGAALAGWAIYAKNRSSLEAYLPTVGINPASVPGVTAFSLHSVGWFILFLVLTVGLLALIFSGQFGGSRGKWGGILLGSLMLVDLGRADHPWIVHWDTGYKYASNPILDQLAIKPWEHRATRLPFGVQGIQQLNLFASLYDIEWKQHLFLANNIQCLDVVMEPHMGVDKMNFLGAMQRAGSLRMWELTNTRYLLGLGIKEFVDAINQNVDPVGKRFHIMNLPDGRPSNFEIVPKNNNPPTALSDFTVVPSPTGQLAVVEFTGALPRASLYANWQVITDDSNTLQTLASPAFDPHQTVLVADPIPAPGAAVAGSGQSGVTVEINSNYKPKRVELSADVKVPSVLLLCDRFNPKWQVWVDGKQEKVLRCNFIERGVFLQPGKHDVVFRFIAPKGTFYISLAAIVTALMLCGWMGLSGGRESDTAAISDSPGVSAARTVASQTTRA